VADVAACNIAPFVVSDLVEGLEYADILLHFGRLLPLCLHGRLVRVYANSTISLAKRSASVPWPPTEALISSSPRWNRQNPASRTCWGGAPAPLNL